MSLLYALPVSGEKIATVDFFQDAVFRIAELSPDGQHLAITAMNEGQVRLVILRTDTLKGVSGFKVPKSYDIDGIWWANDERVVFSTTIRRGPYDRPLLTGELYALNIDNTQKFAIAGSALGEYAAFEVLDVLPDKRRRIRVVRYEVRNRSIARSQPMSYEIDIYTRPPVVGMSTRLGRKKRTGRVTGPYAWGSLVTDHSGEVRLAYAIDRDGTFQVSYKDKARDAWRELPDFQPAREEVALAIQFPVIGFSPDNRSVYYLAESQHGTIGVNRFDIDKQTHTTEYAHERFDLSPSDLEFAPDGELLGVNLLSAYPEAVYFSESPEAEFRSSLAQSMSGSRVSFVSQSDDGRYALVASDRNPGVLYLLDRLENEMRHLFDRIAGLDADLMRPTEPFALRGPSGLLLYGFLTLPDSGEAKPPLVVIPHGGPHGVRDSILFNPESQFLANRGYAVLRVNFRGSAGYGVDHLRAGVGAWGTGMIDDIALAVRWASDKGRIDSGRVCIYGGSYGAYAAMQSTIRHPELFHCAVGVAGVYDLTIMNDSDISFLPWGKAYLRHVLGTDKTALRDQSPALNADRIQVPVFLAHGGEDERAPIVHANSLRRALEAAQSPPEWLVYPDESHGFYLEAHRVEFYERLVAFFDRHIGRPAVVGE